MPEPSDFNQCVLPFFTAHYFKEYISRANDHLYITYCYFISICFYIILHLFTVVNIQVYVLCRTYITQLTFNQQVHIQTKQLLSWDYVFFCHQYRVYTRLTVIISTLELYISTLVTKSCLMTQCRCYLMCLLQLFVCLYRYAHLAS